MAGGSHGRLVMIIQKLRESSDWQGTVWVGSHIMASKNIFFSLIEHGGTTTNKKIPNGGNELCIFHLALLNVLFLQKKKLLANIKRGGFNLI